MTPANGPRQRSLGSVLSALSLAAALPAIVFAGLLIYTLWDRQQSQALKDMTQAVRTLSVALEREIGGQVGRAQMLADDPVLDPSRADEFTRRARDVLARNADWANIALANRDGRHLLNALVPDQVQRPPPGPPRAAEVFDSGRPTVSDVFQVPGTDRWAVSILVPVVRDGAVASVLIVRLQPSALERIVSDLQQEQGGAVAILDRQLRVVARNRGMPEVMGRPATADAAARMSAADRGISRARNLDGIDVYNAWQRSAYGWTVAIGLPAAAYDAPLRSSLLGLVLIAAVLLALGLALARWMARGITVEIRQLAADAARLPAGEPLPERASRIAELATLRSSLGDTAGRLATLLESERGARGVAEHANRSKDEFLAMVGHELRNPLSAVTTAARLLSRPEPTPAQRGHAVAIIERQASHLKRLVDDLLDVTRLLTGKISLSRQPVDLAQVVAQSCETLRAVGATARHQVEVHCDPVPVDGDPMRLEQVVSNLIGNALRYTPAGGRVRITVDRSDDQRARLCVEDNGIGIDATLLPQVFERFVQGKHPLNRLAGGLGIGLAITRHIVELHGGSIALHSAGTDCGTLAIVLLPLSRVAPAAPVAAGGIPDEDDVLR